MSDFLSIESEVINDQFEIKVEAVICTEINVLVEVLSYHHQPFQEQGPDLGDIKFLFFDV